MPTTNPVPSTDPTDLLFNAGKLDEVVNGTANSFTDRLGATRRTVAGMNADFDAQLADAESDLNVYRADAAASAAQALGYLNTIRTTSYGAYAGDPATDPLGNPPTVGDEYFNTTANLLKRWNGTTWQASDINTANLAAPSGSSLVGHDSGTVQDVLDAVTGPTGAASVGYTPAGTGAVVTTVQGKLREIVSVKDSGILGNGTDETAKFEAALMAANGKVLDGCGLTVKVNAAIVSASENIKVQNLTLDYSSAPDLSATEDFLLTFRGSQGSAQTLSASALADTAIVQVPSTAGFTVDGYAWIFSNGNFSSVSTLGQIVKIKSIDSGTTTTLYSDLLYSFTTADTAQIAPLTLKKNITLENVKFIGANANKQSMLNLEYCDAPLVNRCTFNYCDLISVRLKRCTYPRVTNSDFRHSKDSLLGYGVAVVDGCYGAKITDNSGEDMRHMVTFGGTSGVNVFGLVAHNIGSGMKDAGIDAHPATDFTAFSSNVIECVRSTASPTPRDGIIYQGANPTIIGNTLIGAFIRSIAVEHYSSAVGKATILISGNHIKNAGDAGTTTVGIKVETDIAGTVEISSLVINGNIIGGDQDHSIFIDAQTSSIRNISIVGNVVEAANDNFSIYLNAAASVSISDFAISANVFESAGATCLHMEGAATPRITNGIITGNKFKAANYGIRYIQCQGITERGNILAGPTNANFIDTGSTQIDIDRSISSISSIRTTTNSASTITAENNFIIVNRAGTHTMTLPSPSEYPNRELRVKTIQAQAVVSASANVVPVDSDVAGTAVLPATDGAWALLKSDGTNWIIMQRG